MSKFSLENFRKPERKTELPDWVLSGPPATLKLYQAVQEIVSEIETRIQSSDKKPLTIKERSLVSSKIAERAGIDKSNIRKDRQIFLIKFINEENFRLEQMWKNTTKHSKSGRRMSKPELERIKSEYEKEFKDLRNSNFVDYFHEALSSEVLNDQKALIGKYKQLENDYEKAQVTIANLRKQNSELLRQFNR